MSQVIQDYIPFKFEIVDSVDSVNESAQSEVANSKGAILAIVKGKHFVPGGVSRNHRKYTEELWDAVSKDEKFNERLEKKQVIGRIGHEAEMTDMDIAEGHFSHYTRNIDWKTGEAESVIVNTPMGNTLLTLLRAGVTMYVSSRADGDYDGKDEDGNDILDPKTYVLERFDFVQDPGFLDAHPKMITESKKTAGFDEVRSLLEMAHDLEVPLDLDASTYMVESCNKDGVQLTDTRSHISESYEYDAFEDVVQDVRSTIVNHVKELRESLAKVEANLKIARYANSKGLDESYVKEKVKEGIDMETLRCPAPLKNKYKITESQSIAVNDSFLERLFTGNLK